MTQKYEVLEFFVQTQFFLIIYLFKLCIFTQVPWFFFFFFFKEKGTVNAQMNLMQNHF